MGNLKKNLIRMMSCPSSKNIKKSGTTRVGPNGINPPRRCSRRKRTHKRVSLYAMNERSLDTSSQSAKNLRNQRTITSIKSPRKR